MDQIKIGKFIADCRKKANLTQIQLAEKLSITDRAVSKWETGKALQVAVNTGGCRRCCLRSHFACIDYGCIFRDDGGVAANHTDHHWHAAACNLLSVLAAY